MKLKLLTRIILLINCLFSLSLSAKLPLPPLELKMWNYLIQSQISDNNTIRTKGEWPSYSRFSETQIHSLESNSFITTQILLAIFEINKIYDLPHVDSVYLNANLFLDKFLFDSKMTNEPEGTIAYWPLIETPNGKWIRSFSTKFPYRDLKVFNIPNDLDASANLYSWYIKTNQKINYLNSFELTVSQFIDINREQLYPNDLNWKSKNSGAFLTWAEPDKAIKVGSRIFKGINDVDCIVNLNILTALINAQNSFHELSFETNHAMMKSCELINKVVIQNKINQCAVWYDRPSQFFTAYSKAFLAQNNTFDCLNDSMIDAELKLIDLAQKSISKTNNLTETSEFLAAIKRFIPPNARSDKLNHLIKLLDSKIRANIIEKSNIAKINSTESLFIAKMGPVVVEWFSEQFSTAIALLALRLP